MSLVTAKCKAEAWDSPSARHFYPGETVQIDIDGELWARLKSLTTPTGDWIFQFPGHMGKKPKPEADPAQPVADPGIKAEKDRLKAENQELAKVGARVTADAKPTASVTKRKMCVACGSPFGPTSNRQLRCPSCLIGHRKRLNREAQARFRAKALPTA